MKFQRDKIQQAIFRRLRSWICLLGFASFGILAPAAEKQFSIGGTTLTLQDVSSDVSVTFRSMRLNRAQNVWNVEAALTNAGDRTFQSPFIVVIESSTDTAGLQGTDGDDGGAPPAPFYDFSTWISAGGLGPVSTSSARTLAFGMAAGVPGIRTRVFARAPSGNFTVALARSLNEAGQPLPGVTVEEIAPDSATTNSFETDLSTGLVTLGRTSGLHRWKFSKPGYLPVWRELNIRTGQVELIAPPRLTRESTHPVTLSPLDGGQIAQPGVRLQIPGGAFANPATGSVTRLSGQTLPALLPAGWSPLQAFYANFSSKPALAATADLALNDALRPGDGGVLVRWDESALRWKAVQLMSGNGSSNLTVTVADSGFFALLVPDAAPSPTPPPAQLNQAVDGANSLPVSGWSAMGAVDPPISPASRNAELVTAQATVIFSNATVALTSGTLFRGAVKESYVLQDGTRRLPPGYEQTIVAYQRPGDLNPRTLQAQFPLRPLLLFGADELAGASVKVDVLQSGAFEGAVLAQAGGQIGNGEVRIVAGNGDLVRDQAVEIRRLNPEDFFQLSGASNVVAAFELSVSGVADGRQLLSLFGPQTANSSFLVARVLWQGGNYGLEPIRRLNSGGDGQLTDAEPATGDRLPGIRSAGQFILLRLIGPQTLITGTVSNSTGQVGANLAVQVAGSPWLSLSDAAGHYRLISPAGPVVLRAVDPASGDANEVSGTIDPGATVFLQNLATLATGPRVISTTPVDHAVSVPRVTPVVVQFSKPINPATLGANGVQLFGSNGAPVSVSVSLNLRNTMVTLLPAVPLAPSADHSILVAPGLRDTAGRPLEGTNAFTFRTETDQLNRGAAQVISYEPTNGVAIMIGTAGISEPEKPVILVNETTGQTATILSRPDGSFSNSIPADLDDFLSAVMVNGNGTRNTIPVSRQLLRDGSVGLFNGGGILEAQSDGGPVQVIVEPGSIPSKTTFKLETKTFADVLLAVRNTLPTNAVLLGGFKVSARGDDLTESVDVAFPIEPGALNLPAGARPEDASFVLTVSHEIDGKMVYEVVDRMHYENGKLVTHSPPFFGLVAAAVGTLAMPMLLAQGNSIPIFGEVREVQHDENDRVVGTPRFLAGALVRMNPANGRQAQMSPGELYTTTDHRGKYAFLVPVNSFEGAGFTMVASHPRFPDRLAMSGQALPSLFERFLTGNVLGIGIDFVTQDLASIGGTPADNTPPTIHAFHAPFLPAPSNHVSIVVVATDNRSRPTVSVEVESVTSLVEGITVNNSDVQIGSQTNVNVGARGVRTTIDVVANKALEAVFTLKGTDGAGRVGQIAYPIRFGGTDTVTTNAAPSDQQDRVGPQVVQSWPPEKGAGVRPGDPLVVVFNEPIERAILTDISPIQISPSAGKPVVSLSENQRELSIHYPGLDPGTDYRLTLTGGIKDLSGNRLDQVPDETDTSDNYVLSFSTAPERTGNLPGIQNGGGAVLRGRYAYALERAGALNGSMAVFDLQDPAHPTKVAEIDLPAYPRDMVLIPKYSFQRRPGGAVTAQAPVPGQVETKDLIAVCGGTVGGEAGGQFLWIIDISNPLQPQRVASTLLTLSTTAAATKMAWSPPLLSWLNTEAGANSIGVINLQAFIYGDNLSTLEFRQLDALFKDGDDLNGDGDFTDPGELLPLPARIGPFFPGLVDILTLGGETQSPIMDFSSVKGGATVGIVVSEGQELRADGVPRNPVVKVKPAYRTLMQDGELLERIPASLEFASTDRPRRVQLFLGTQLNVQGTNRNSDIALVSLNARTLVVIDITDPLNPERLNDLTFAEEHGDIYSIQRGPDGNFILNTFNDLLILDPLQLAVKQTVNTDPPAALVGVIKGAGTAGIHSFGADLSGLYLLNGNGKQAVVQSAPLLRFVSFSGLDPFQPSTLASATADRLKTVFDHLEFETTLRISRFKAQDTDVPSNLTPPDSGTHYYTMIFAPGSAGETIDISLESLNRAGYPLRARGMLFPPVRAVSDRVLTEIKQVTRACDAPVRTSRAWRVSSNPADPNYNVYLTRPFALVYEEMSQDDLATVQGALDRDILWSGHFLRSSLDASMDANSVIGMFAGKTDANEKVVRTGTAAKAVALGADYIMGPNPMPIIGGVTAAAAFGSLGAHNGEVMMAPVDMTLPGRRLPLEFRRASGGQALYEGPFGRGWDFNFNQRVVELREDILLPGTIMPLVKRTDSADSERGEARDLLLYTGGGRTMLYKYAGTNAPAEFKRDPLVVELGWDTKPVRYYTSPKGAFNMMVKFPDGKFARLEPDGMQFWYSPQGRLEVTYDRYEKNRLQCNYNNRGELVRILDDGNRPLKLGYWRFASDPDFESGLDEVTDNAFIAGKIHRLKDPTDRDVLFYYDSDGLLERREGPQVTVVGDGGFTGRQVTRYLSSDCGTPSKTARSTIGMQSGSGNGTPLLVGTQIGDGGRDLVKGLSTPSGSVNLAMTHANTAESVSAGGAQSTITGQDGSAAKYLFDKFGRPLSTELTGANAGSEKTQFTYNEHGLTTKIIYPEGNSEEITYDEDNENLRARANVLKIAKKAGSRGGSDLESRATFDSKYNQATSKTDFNGNVATITLTSDKKNPETITSGGETESYSRNQYGQMTKYVSPDHVETSFSFNDDGFLESKTVGGMTTQYHYSGKPGKLGFATTIINPKGVSAEYVYDERNQVVRQTVEGYVVENSYDEKGFITKITTTQDAGVKVVEDRTLDQLGFMLSRTVRGVEVDGSPVDLLTSYVPDESSRLKKVTFPSGEIHEMTYDHAGRISEYKVGSFKQSYTYDLNGNVKTSKIGDGTEIYTYDGHDRILTTTTPINGVIDDTYDGNNNVLTHKVTDPEFGVISDNSYTFDARNRCTIVTRIGSSSSAVVHYDYDSAGRSLKMTDASGQITTTTYDQAARVQSVVTPSRRIQYTYDANGNVETKTSIENGISYTETFGYDRRDNLTSITDNNGKQTLFTVGYDGRVASITDREGHVTGQTQNSLGELVSTTKPDGVQINYKHSANRESSAITDTGGKGLSRSYDSVGRLTSVTHANGTSSTFSNFDDRNAARNAVLPGGINIAYTFDKEGKILTRDISGAAGSRSETYKHDVLGRIRRITDSSGSVEYQYDKLGYATSIISVQNGVTYQVNQSATAAGFRSSVDYPSGVTVTDVRDATGRLTGINPSGGGAPVFGSATYATDSLMGGCQIGPSLISMDISYDQLKRPVKWSYRRNSDQKILAEVRYAYSDSGAQLARQWIHRGGRTDFFAYDSAYRLTGFDLGARPEISGQSVRSVPGFAVPAHLNGNWSPGYFHRTWGYTLTDVLSAGAIANPDSLPALPFASSYGPPDDSRHVADVDGSTRGVDDTGNVTSSRLWVRVPGSATPVAVDATLVYNELSQLIRVERADGVTVENEYGPGGLRIRRHVTGNPSLCVPSDLGFVYDGGNLIEVRDLAHGGTIRTRYYYGDDGDELMGGDLFDPGTGLPRRHYFLTDALRSVAAVADSAGDVVERVNYDAWGQPQIQGQDSAAPRAAEVRADGQDLLVIFSEPILPVLSASGGSALISTYESLAGSIQVTTNGVSAGGSVRYEETAPGVPFGSTLRFHPDALLEGQIQVRISGSALQDEWGNTNTAEVFVLLTNAPPGAPLYVGAGIGSTAPPELGRSALESPFLFHGQVFDYDSGLIYCRARFYDPAVGLFLQRDPAGYEDSVNQYAGFNNNPVNFRDPTGTAVRSMGESGSWLSLVGSQASYKEDGLFGAFVGGAIQFVGGVMQLGTGAAEGLDKLEHVRSGPMGVLDIKEGLSLIAGDAMMFAAATSMGGSAAIGAKRRYGSTIKAYAISGVEAGRDLIGQKLGRRTGAGIAMNRYGHTATEVSSIHQALKDARAMGQETTVTIRGGADVTKGQHRREWVNRGVPQKRAIDWEGKSGPDALMKSKADGKIVVSDLDIAGVKINGKLGSTGDYARFERTANKHYLQKREGIHPDRPANAPFQHHGQFQVADQYGKDFLGHELNHSKLGAIGHPGHCVTFRLDAKGNLLVHRTPGWSVDADIMRTEMRLRSRIAELDPHGATVLGINRDTFLWQLPRSWHSWKD